MAIVRALLCNRAMFDQAFVADATKANLVDALCRRVSQRIEARLRRLLAEQAHVEYFDGERQVRHWLRNGPLVTLTSLESIDYGTAGETATIIAATDYVTGGKREEGATTRAWIELLGTAFLLGSRNYRATYTAGWSALGASGPNDVVFPEDLQELALELAIEAFTHREHAGETSRTQDNLTVSRRELESWDEAIERRLGAYLTADEYV